MLLAKKRGMKISESCNCERLELILDLRFALDVPNVVAVQSQIDHLEVAESSAGTASAPSVHPTLPLFGSSCI